MRPSAAPGSSSKRRVARTNLRRHSFESTKSPQPQERCAFSCGEIDSFPMSSRGCSHLDAIASVKQPKRRECEECVKIGSTWVHLRTCQTCGGTRCCDSSPNRHASKHARSSTHPVIASAEPGERWLYCYPDDSSAEYWRNRQEIQGARV